MYNAYRGREKEGKRAERHGVRNPLWRHVPPVAMPVTRSDFAAGLGALSGPERALETFAAAVMQWTETTGCRLVASGRAALTSILLGLRKRSERSRVIVPAYGCPTIVQSVLYAGLTPVFCDVDPRTLDLDRRMLRSLLAEGAPVKDTLAVVTVHLYGLAHDVQPVLELAHAGGVFVIEDAAQAFGARVAGRMVGTWGDAGFYSLGRGKCLPVGRGGVIVAQGQCAEMLQDAKGAAPRWDVASLARLFGYSIATHPRVWWLLVRTPLNPADAGMDLDNLPPIVLGRLSAVGAGVGASMLGRFEEVRQVQRRHARQLTAAMTGFEGLAVPEVAPDAEPVFLRLPIVLESEELTVELFDALSARGIGVSRSYRRSLPDLFAPALATDKDEFPGAQRLSRCLLTLPTHAYVTEADIARIKSTVQDILAQRIGDTPCL